MTRYIVDTNVVVAANGRDTHASVCCRIKAGQALSEIRHHRSLILDSGRKILSEYGKYCNFSGQPSVGDEFFRWVFDNMGSLQIVSLSPNDSRGFDEFPDDDSLARFDPDDRVFVALSIASASSLGENQIINALDSDYSHFHAGLAKYGVQVKELCEDELKPSS